LSLPYLLDKAAESCIFGCEFPLDGFTPVGIAVDESEFIKLVYDGSFRNETVSNQSANEKYIETKYKNVRNKGD